MGKYNKTSYINGKKFQEKLKERGCVLRRVSKDILGKGDGYIARCLRNGIMNTECLEKLCIMYNLKSKDYVIIEEKPQPKTMTVEKALKTVAIDPTASGVTEEVEPMDMKVIADKLDTLIVGIAQLNRSIASMSVKDDIDNLSDGISRVNSTLNIINGRCKDICDSWK